jgi:Ca2+-binding RTX toxin-like protein
MTTTRCLALALTALVCTALPAPPSTAAAAVAVCQGETATIVATGPTVDGTTGSDVIYSDHQVAVRGLAGDDKVCIPDGGLDGGDGHDSLEVRGTDFVDEHINAVDVEHLDIVLGRGYNWVSLRAVPGGTGVIDTGDGGGELEVFGSQSITLLMGVGHLSVDGGSYVAKGFTDVVAGARGVHIRGNDLENQFRVIQRSCDVVLQGGGADDIMRYQSNLYGLPSFGDCGDNVRSFMKGQGGDDLMVGWRGDDLLVGGRGDDIARGGRGTNTCDAEDERNCQA